MNPPNMNRPNEASLAKLDDDDLRGVTGGTLVELNVVISIIGVLIGDADPKLVEKYAAQTRAGK